VDVTQERVLVADDEAPLRRIIARTVTAMGFTVVEVADGIEVMDALKQSNFALILLDLLMPRLNGYEVLQRLAEDPDLAQTPVVVISGENDPTSLVRVASAGALEHVEKPFGFAQVQAAVKEALSLSNDQLAERRSMLKGIAEDYKVDNDLPEQAILPEEQPARRGFFGRVFRAELSRVPDVRPRT